MADTKYYLRDARTGKKIQLETSETRLTILVKEKDPVAIKKALSQIETMAPNASLRKISSRVYEIEYPNNPPDEEINKLILRIRKQVPNVIPYNVYKAKDRYGLIYITDEIIVTFSAGTSADSIKRLTEKYNLNQIDEYADGQLIYVFAQKPGNWDNPIEVANKMENEKGVEIAEPNLVHRLVNTLARPTDTFFGKQWQLETNNQPNVSPDAHVNAREAWDRLNGGGDPNVVVAVVDFGFDLTHPDLVNKLVNIDLDLFDFVDRKEGDPKFPKPDLEFTDHGTSCAGIAVAEKNGAGVVGIAFGCSLLPVCIPDSPESKELCRIFLAIRNKADVISCSFAPEFGTTALSAALENLIEEITKSGGRRGKGCVICFAAGNGNLPLDKVVTNPKFFVNMRPEQKLGTFKIINPYASHKEVIAVAASTTKNKKAVYSNWGKEIWVCAPSDDIVAEDGRIIEPRITTTSSIGNLGNKHYTDSFGGTSSAAPLVAGIAALVISANPTLTAKEVKDIIKATADPIDPENDEAGKYDNGHSIWYGFGKVNAGKAVKRALEMHA
ncbi:MAG TPA: S8 family serine peptidase [Chitinophagaceae bacterium]